MAEKPIDRLYLEAISDLAEAVNELRAWRSNSSVAREMELKVDEHMAAYTRLMNR